jgi:DNA repair exonuclease SbcCD nuclease subunit
MDKGDARAMRLVHLADIHLGFRQYQRQTPAGINQREADVATSMRRVIDKVIELKPDLVLIAGDVFPPCGQRIRRFCTPSFNSVD